jgi:hypothetical protein
MKRLFTAERAEIAEIGGKPAEAGWVGANLVLDHGDLCCFQNPSPFCRGERPFAPL